MCNIEKDKMKFSNNMFIVTSLIGIFLLQTGSADKDKWKAVPLKIKKQESFNYSEIISGKLDSTAKSELEEVKNKIAKENNDLSKQLDEHRSENTSDIFNTIWESMKNIYNWFLDLF